MTTAACVHCTEAIDVARNHIDGDSPAHIYCAATTGLYVTPPDATTAQERQRRDWLRQFTMSGSVVTGNFHETSAMTAERGAKAGWVAWDIPAGAWLGPHFPWLTVTETACPGEPWSWDHHDYERVFTCWHKHFHPRAGRLVQSFVGDARVT